MSMPGKCKAMFAASGAVAVGALGLLASPPPAHAAGCNQWGFNGPFTLQHTLGGWRVETNLNGANDTGPEPAVYIRDDNGSPPARPDILPSVKPLSFPPTSVVT
jgi:hypothetical protein